MALSTAQILQLIADNLPDNTSNIITPELHREVLVEMAGSYANLISSVSNLGLSEWSNAKTYPKGQCVVLDNVIYQSAVANTTIGSFVEADWTNITEGTSGGTADYLLKTNAIQLKDNNLVEHLTADAYLRDLETGFYTTSTPSIFGLTEEYPIDKRGMLQSFKSEGGGIYGNQMYFTFDGEIYLRDANIGDWIKISQDSQTSYTFSEGLNDNAGDITVGGDFQIIDLIGNASSEFNVSADDITLTGDITLNTNTNINGILTVDGSVSMTNDNSTLLLNSNSIDITADLNITGDTVLDGELNVTGNTTLDEKATYTKSNYNADYSDIAPLDIPDSQYVEYIVDKYITESPSTIFENGLNTTIEFGTDGSAGLTTVKLGGTLTENVDINMDGFNFNMNDVDGSEFNINTNNQTRIVKDGVSQSYNETINISNKIEEWKDASGVSRNLNLFTPTKNELGGDIILRDLEEKNVDVNDRMVIIDINGQLFYDDINQDTSGVAYTTNDYTTAGLASITYVDNGDLVLQTQIDNIIQSEHDYTTAGLASITYVDNGDLVLQTQIDNITHSPDYTTAGLATTIYVDNADTILQNQIDSLDIKDYTTAGLATTVYVDNADVILQNQIDAITHSPDYTTAGLATTVYVDNVDVILQNQIDSLESATTGINDSLDIIQTKLDTIETGAEVNQTDSEIKTQYENNANTNEFSDSEKSKLASLDSSKFLGEYVDLSSLQTAHPSPVVGSYANVDAGVGQDVKRYIWDSDDNIYVEQLGTSTILTDAQIKTQYENNADTNAYTDSEKTKVGFISVTQAVDLDTMESDIAVNNAKTGITTQQASDIVTNNAKVGITTQQASDITANNAKVGITTQQASDITTNNAKVTNAVHTGDVTGSDALTITNDVVSNAKLANMATQTIKGRDTAGTGDPEDLTPTQIRTMLNVEDGATANDYTTAGLASIVYVNDAISSIPSGGSEIFGNGLENFQGTVGLGGSLDRTSQIELNGKLFIMKDATSHVVFSESGSFSSSGWTLPINQKIIFTEDTANKTDGLPYDDLVSISASNAGNVYLNSANTFFETGENGMYYINTTASNTNFNVTNSTISFQSDNQSGNLLVNPGGLSVNAQQNSNLTFNPGGLSVTNLYGDVMNFSNNDFSINSSSGESMTYLPSGDLNVSRFNGVALTNGGSSIMYLNAAGGYSIPTMVLGDNTVTNFKLSDMTDGRIKGRASGASVGDPQDLTASQVRTIINVEDGATADQSDAEIKTAYENNADTNAFTDSEQSKLGFVSVTQAVDLDTMESDITTNNAKVTNSTHTGDVTGATALTIANDAVTNTKLANMSEGKIKGREIGAGTGDPQDLSANAIKGIIESDSRVGFTTSLATLNLTMDTIDAYEVTALAVPITINAPTGTLARQRKLTVRLKDNGTARAITWNAVFRSIATLPTTTTANKTLYVGFIYNVTDTVWDCIAVSEEA